MFSYNGWTVEIFFGEVQVEAPGGGTVDVRVYDEGVYVFGSDSGYWEETPRAVTIPWAVVEAIIEARKGVKNG